MKVILHYIKPFVPRMSLGIFVKFLGAITELLLPWILSYLIDDVVPLRDLGLILLWGGRHDFGGFGRPGDQHRGQPHGRLGCPAHHPGLAPRPVSQDLLPVLLSD